MSAYDIALPPAPIAQAFEDTVRATTERIAAQIQRIAAQIHESQCLAVQRDVLLSRIVNRDRRRHDGEVPR